MSRPVRGVLRRRAPQVAFAVLLAVLVFLAAMPSRPSAGRRAAPSAFAESLASDGRSPVVLAAARPQPVERWSGPMLPTTLLPAWNSTSTEDDGELRGATPATVGGARTGTASGSASGSASAGSASAGSASAGSASDWTPPTPLPAPATGSQRIDVVLSPHPDDETLSLGVWAADAAAHGDRVIVVCLTDGRTTGAITAISQRLRRAVTRDEIAAARIREVTAATERLGVRPGDVYLAHLDAETGPGGTRLTEPEARAVIGAFAARFPSATFATMSWTAERHPDHLSAGLALHEAVGEGLVRHAVFAVSRLWWALPSPPTSVVLPLSAAVRRRVQQAADAYDLWDPADRRWAVGWTSVHHQFAALVADPRDRIHDWAPSTGE